MPYLGTKASLVNKALNQKIRFGSKHCFPLLIYSNSTQVPIWFSDMINDFGIIYTNPSDFRNFVSAGA